MFICFLLLLVGLLFVVVLLFFVVQLGVVKGVLFSGCVVKQVVIEVKLEMVCLFVNEGQVVGLEKVFFEVKEYCIEVGLLRENKQKVIDSECEVSECEKDLCKVMGKGDLEKIEKCKVKLVEVCVELEEVKKGLEQVQVQQDIRYCFMFCVFYVRCMMFMVLFVICVVVGYQVLFSVVVMVNECQCLFVLFFVFFRYGV